MARAREGSSWREAAPAAIGEDRRHLTTAELSQVISFSRIALIVGLVFLHYGQYPNVSESPFNGVDGGAYHVANLINSFVLFFFFSAVPLLSMISGWLFFSFRSDVVPELARRIWRRFKSLYVPLVLWNGLFLLLMWLLFRADSGHPLLADLNVRFETASWTEYADAVLAITRYPIGFQFWFVRDLFVTVLFSPLLWIALKRVPLAGAAALAVVWFSGLDLWVFFRADVVFFFYLGGLLRYRATPLEISVNATLWLLLGYVLIVAARTLAPYIIVDDAMTLDLATRAMRLVGVLACWGLFQQFALSSAGEAVSRYGKFAFFVYAAHFPLIAALKIFLWAFVPAETDAWMLVHYVTSVLLTVSLGMTVGIALARFAPKQFALMNGGRSA